MDKHSPEVFFIKAINEIDPTQSVTEPYWRSVYMHDADRYLEASKFAERMIEQGYIVEYSEHE